MRGIQKPKEERVSTLGLPTPSEIKAHLDEYVIEQEDAKKVISVAVYNHYKRIQDSGEGVQLGKSNILMIGPTGSGKTYVCSMLAKALDVPFTIGDATSILSSGGRDIEAMIEKLLAAAGGDPKKAERGIIYIDEIDKLAERYSKTGKRVQQALLKCIEGSIIAGVDTGNILFIVGGAFVDLEFVIADRIGGGHINFEGVMISELIKNVTPGDLKLYGMIPEFVGRVPIYVGLNELNVQALIDILTVPKNALAQQYKKMFAMDDVELEFTIDALAKVAQLAQKLKTGARGLRTIMEDRMREVMFHAPSNKDLQKVTITAEVITDRASPIFDFVYANPDPELAEITPKREKKLIV